MSTLTPEEIKQEEQNTGQNDHLGSSESQANDELGALQGSWDTNFDGKNTDNWGKQSRFKFSRRKKAAGGVVGLGIGGIFAIFSILQGPAQLVHASQLLSNFHFAPSQIASASRIGRLYEYFRASSRDDHSIRNISYMGEKLTNRFRGQLSDIGIEMDFTNPDGNGTRRLQAFRVSDPDTIKLLESQGLEHDGNGNFDFRNAEGAEGRNRLSTRERRKALYAAVDALDKGKFSSVITKRMLAVRAGVDFHPFRNVRREAGESLADFYRRTRSERSTKHKNGVNARAGTTVQGQEPDTDNPDPEGERSTREHADRVENIAADAADADGREGRRSLARQILGSPSARAAGAAAAVSGALCAVRAIGDSIGPFKEANINLPMIRMAMEVVSMGSQIQAGQDINLEEVGEVVDTFYNEEDGSLFGAAGMQAVAGEEVTGPDTDVKPSYNDGKPAFFNTIDSLESVLKPVCAIQEGVGAFLNTLSFGALNRVSDAAVNGALGVFGTSQEKLMDRLLAALSGDLVDTFAQGSELGNIVAIGGRLSANSAAIASGGTEMSPAEFNIVLNSFQEQEQVRIAQLPLKDRLFNLRSGDSLATITLAKMPYIGSSSGFTSAARDTPRLFSSSFSSLFSVFTPKASAATTYDFGVPAYGITQDMLDDPNLADPYAVEDAILDSPSAYEKYEKCYSTKINYDTGTISENDDWDPTVLDDSECTDNSAPARKFSMYMFDLVTFKGAACGYGIDEQACSEVGFGGSGGAPSSGAQTGGLGVSADGFTFPLQTTKDVIINDDPGEKWCYRNTSNCHHDYNAADIFAPTGTPVVASRGGTVVAARDNDNSRVGSRVTIKADDGNLYYYSHMGEGTIRVSVGDVVTGGQVIGAIGTNADAVNTKRHLHIDVLPSSIYSSRPGCSGASCTQYPFIDIQGALVEAFNRLPG